MRPKTRARRTPVEGRGSAKTMLALRVPDQLRTRLVAYTETVRNETGYEVSLTAIVVKLLTEALDAVGAKPK